MDVVTYAALKAEIDALGGHIEEDVANATEAWLEENVDPDTGYVLDRTLEMQNAAAPADLVGDLKTAITQLDKKIDDNTFIIGDTVSIQRVTNASQFTKNNPRGYIYVESTNKPIFTGTVNFIDLFGLAQGTFADNGTGGSGVIIEISGNECYIHGSPTKGFRFDLQKGEFYSDSFANHLGDLSILPDIEEGYRLCFFEKSGYTMPTNIYFAKLNDTGSAISPAALSGNSGDFYQNNTYLGLYSNNAISNLDIKFTFGLKQKNAPATVCSVEECSKAQYNTTIIQSAGYYECGELTWTGSDTNCSVKTAYEKEPNLEKNHVFAWFGDSLSQLRVLPNLVEKLLVTKVYDCTFAGSPLTYGDPTLYQPTGFMSLCSQIVAGNFSELSAALTAQQSAGIDVTEKLAHLATLQALDFSTVTDIVVFAGTNDFDSDYVNATNFVSGFSNALDTLLTAYPHLMVYVFSPTWRGDKTEGVQTIPTMSDLVDLEKDVADAFSLPFYDLYHRSGINEYTATVYLENDLLHPSAAGDELLANKCAKFILSN